MSFFSVFFHGPPALGRAFWAVWKRRRVFVDSCVASDSSYSSAGTNKMSSQFTAFRMKQLLPPLARWGAAAGSIGFFLLYEDLPQLIMQTQYGDFPGWTGVAQHYGLMAKPKEEE